MSQQNFRKRATFHASKWTWRPIRNFLDQSSWYNSQIRLWQRWSCGLQVNLFSEALILSSTNPDFSLNYEFSTWKLQAKNMGRTCCVHKLFLFWHSEQFMYTTCSEHAIFMYWTSNSMNNLSSYCGLVDAKIRGSDKDLPVQRFFGHSQKLPFEHRTNIDFEELSQSFCLCWRIQLLATKVNFLQGVSI